MDKGMQFNSGRLRFPVGHQSYCHCLALLLIIRANMIIDIICFLSHLVVMMSCISEGSNRWQSFHCQLFGGSLLNHKSANLDSLSHSDPAPVSAVDVWNKGREAL